jgi:hypothetical protein
VHPSSDKNQSVPGTGFSHPPLPPPPPPLLITTTQLPEPTTVLSTNNSELSRVSLHDMKMNIIPPQTHLVLSCLVERGKFHFSFSSFSFSSSPFPPSRPRRSSRRFPPPSRCHSFSYSFTGSVLRERNKKGEEREIGTYLARASGEQKIRSRGEGGVGGRRFTCLLTCRTPPQ